jgi:Asp-tRNA(Asn)/Glu-tRNA(Gln) amidotransferase A subunit family amidase
MRGAGIAQNTQSRKMRETTHTTNNAHSALMSTRPLTEFLHAVSAFRRYTSAQRLHDWEQRFAFGLGDIEQVFEAAVAAEPLLFAPKAQVVEHFEAGRYGLSGPAGEVVSASAAQIAHQVRRQALSPVTIAEAFLARIEAHRHLNAFITVNPALVMEEAGVLAHRLKRGEDLGPLAGVPVGVKDLMSVRGYPLTAGTRAIEGKIQERDALVVARLRAAGALIVGTTNLHELAFGINSANPHFGHVQNPRYPGYIPGGSSGGSAAAVAAELVAIGVGSCTGGSIRLPAACCGIVGFKPTYDAVPREGVYPLAWSLDHIGPMTRNVEDAALAFEVMAGLPEHSMLPRAAISAPRIVLPRNFFYDMLHDEVRAAMDAALARFRAAGAAVGEVNVPGIELAPGIQLITIASEGAQSNAKLLTGHADKLGDDVRLRLEIGQFYLAVDYIKAQQLRNQVRQSMINCFGDAEVMIIPAMPVLPPKSGTTTLELGGKTMHVAPTLTRFTSPINFCGFPALSMPCGNSKAGLPVSLQIVGRPGADAAVLRVGRWCEQVLAA